MKTKTVRMYSVLMDAARILSQGNFFDDLGKDERYSCHAIITVLKRIEGIWMPKYAPFHNNKNRKILESFLKDFGLPSMNSSCFKYKDETKNQSARYLWLTMLAEYCRLHNVRLTFTID